MKPDQSNGDKRLIGTTDDLSLRVSVATLARVLFLHPNNGHTMLALERTATLLESGGANEVVVRARPFGGSVRINDLAHLGQCIGRFNFDSQRSRDEMDFRIFIDPQAWDRAKQFCLAQYQESNGVLEITPQRELREEFRDALGVELEPDDYGLEAIGVSVQDKPQATHSVRAPGLLTVRIYYLFEIRMIATHIITALVQSSRDIGDEELQRLAWRDASHGGAGRANAALVLPWEHVVRTFQTAARQDLGRPLYLQGHRLDRNLGALLAS